MQRIHNANIPGVRESQHISGLYVCAFVTSVRACLCVLFMPSAQVTFWRRGIHPRYSHANAAAHAPLMLGLDGRYASGSSTITYD